MQPNTKPDPKKVFRNMRARSARGQVSPEEQAMHSASLSQHPELSLSPGEYVLEVVRRHPIGLVTIWAITVFLILIALAIAPFYSINKAAIAQIFVIKLSSMPTAAEFAVPTFILAALFLLGGAVAAYVYNANRFYITTESIVQFVQTSLFSSKQQVVNLINVEDVSTDQTGIVQQVLNYGTLRVSTQGQETIYNFRFVANPVKVVHSLNDATEVAIQRLENSNFPPTELAA